MLHTDFIAAYAAALASQNWQMVAPLVHKDASVTFSSGSVNRGIIAIQQAYERNFALIKNEQYTISDVQWLHNGEDIAVYTFVFTWQGIINGEKAGGSGHGTAVIKQCNNGWQLLAEHLGK